VPRKPARSQRLLNPKSAFGIVLRRLRGKHGDSQDSFAHRTGYHRNYIGQLERGEKSPSLSALFTLARSCEMQPSEILKMMEKLLGSH
jgi:transcriptional regulator with XRE-family HTH domain